MNLLLWRVATMPCTERRLECSNAVADPDPQMYANFHTGSPVNLANYSTRRQNDAWNFIKSSARLDGGYRDPQVYGILLPPFFGSSWIT